MGYEEGNSFNRKKGGEKDWAFSCIKQSAITSSDCSFPHLRRKDCPAINTRSRLLWGESFKPESWELDQLGSIIETDKQGQIFNTESDAPELKDGSGTSSGGMKSSFESNLCL